MGKNVVEGGRVAPENGKLVRRLIAEATSGAFFGSVVRIETNGGCGVASEYEGTVDEVNHATRIIWINEAQAREGCPMEAIKGYEWLSG